MESGILDLDTHAKKRQVMMKQRLSKTANNLINEILDTKKGKTETKNSAKTGKLKTNT